MMELKSEVLKPTAKQKAKKLVGGLKHLYYFPSSLTGMVNPYLRPGDCLNNLPVLGQNTCFQSTKHRHIAAVVSIRAAGGRSEDGFCGS